jgi:hypothetical protein
MRLSYDGKSTHLSLTGAAGPNSRQNRYIIRIALGSKWSCQITLTGGIHERQSRATGKGLATRAPQRFFSYWYRENILRHGNDVVSPGGNTRRLCDNRLEITPRSGISLESASFHIVVHDPFSMVGRFWFLSANKSCHHRDRRVSGSCSIFLVSTCYDAKFDLRGSCSYCWLSFVSFRSHAQFARVDQLSLWGSPEEITYLAPRSG